MENVQTICSPTLTANAIKKAILQLYCPEDLSIIGKLGSGFYANVYLVNHLPSKCKMALKVSPSAKIQRREIEILRSLSHENVQRLYGACIIGGKLACLTEYANGGCLVDLMRAKSTPLPWSCRVNLARDIICGLGHLHEHNLIHRDLSSHNILIRVNLEKTPLSSWVYNRGCIGGASCGSSGLSSPLSDISCSANGAETELADFPISERLLEPWDPETPSFLDLPKIPPLTAPINAWHRCGHPPYTAVVGDLGVCLDLRQPNVDTTVIAGSAYCTAPECLRKVAPYSPAADIFAFGLLVCELITRLVNDGSTIPRTSEFGLDVENLPVPSDCPAWFLQLAANCCKVEYLERPSSKDILDQWFPNSVEDPPPPQSSVLVHSEAFTSMTSGEKDYVCEQTSFNRYSSRTPSHNSGRRVIGSNDCQLPVVASSSFALLPDYLG